MRRFATTAAGSSVALLLILGSSASAAADPATDGFWYFDLPHIQDIHDAGVTGKGVTIAVIDDQINLEVPTLKDANIEVQPSKCWDDSGAVIPATSTDITADHGTNIVSYIVGSGAGYPGQTGVKGVAPDATILFFSTGAENATGDIVCNTESGESRYGLGEPATGEAIFRAVDAGVDIISISQAGTGDPYVKVAITNALHAGIVVVAGVQNAGFQDDDFDLSVGFPAAYNGVVGVQSGDTAAQPQGGHVDPGTDVLAPGVNLVWQGDSDWQTQRYATGTSLATPLVAGFLALVADKYPNATGNQLIQTLIRNTGVDDHDLYFDPNGATGYGSASATHMLRVDPTTYEDSNPLLLDDYPVGPTRAEVENPLDEDNWRGEVLPGDGQSDDPDAPSSSGGSTLVPVLAAVGGGLLVVGLIVTVIVVLASRRTRRTTNPPA